MDRHNYTLPFRTQPICGESLTSWVQRLAKENMVTPIQFLVTTRVLETPFIGYKYSSLECNTKKINLDQLARISRVELKDIEAMTFRKLHNKLLSDNFTGVFGHAFHNYRKFCPECLKDQGHFKLIWQVEELKICKEHKVMLLDRCTVCGGEVPCLSSTEFAVCPYCHTELESLTTTPIPVETMDAQKRIYEDWEFLLKSDKLLLPDTSELSNMDTKTSMTTGLMYSLFKGIDVEDSSFKLEHIVSLIQRLSSVLNGDGTKTFRINTIFDVLRAANMSCNEFSNLRVPKNILSLS